MKRSRVFYIGNLHLLWLLVCLSLFVGPAYAEEEDEEVVEQEQVTQALYVQIKPAFVTNYISEKVAFIRADVAVRVNDPMTQAAVEQHMDAIKNAIVFLLSRQEFETVNNPEGISLVREEALEAIIEVLESESAASDVQEVLFTSFILE